MYDLPVAKRPRLLDLFAGAGGCAKGYHDAGFEVVGVDVEFQINYPYRFVQLDAFKANPARFDVIHASPPCKGFTTLSRGNAWKHPDLLTPMRELLKSYGKPYIIENVDGAPMPDCELMCGAYFGLGTVCNDGVWRRLQRHRLFESNMPIKGTGCRCVPGEPVIGVYGGGSVTTPKGTYKGVLAERERAMGIDWMTSRELSQSIPPVYCKFLGEQIMEML